MENKTYKLTDEKKEQLKIVYSPEEMDYYGKLLAKFEHAKQQRSQRLRQFDYLTYEQDYLLNQDVANSFLAPTNNTDEVKINTGTTEKKLEVFINELLAINFKPEVRAYDKDDNEVAGLGQDIQDIIRRTNEIEREDNKKIDILQELLSQRALFVWEKYNLEEVVDRKRSRQGKFDNLPAKKYLRHRAEKEVLSGLQVFLGNIKLPAYKFSKQPYIFIYDRKSYDEAEVLFGSWDRWKYVKAGSGIQEGAFDYRVSAKMEENEVEIIIYFDYPKDNMQIVINGVMMCPIDCPLDYEHEGYPLSMTVLKPVSRQLSYGKSLVSSAKALQFLDNETIRLLVRKMRQAIEPTIGIKSKRNKVVSKDIWAPGTTVYGLGDKDYSVLTPHQGVTASEFQMFNLIQEKIQEFVGSSNISQGLSEGAKSATEIVELRKQAVKMLGLAFFAYMKVVVDTSYLRLYNIIENFTKPIGKKFDDFTNEVVDVFQSFSVDNSTLENGKIGKKKVFFTDTDLNSEQEEEIYNLENEQEQIGNNIRIRMINVKKLREFPLIFDITAVPSQNDSNELDKVMLSEQLNQAGLIAQTTGARIAQDKAIYEFERLWNVKGFFQKAAPMEAGMENDPLMGKINELEATPIGRDMKQGVNAGTKLTNLLKA